jgi:hypothetical protein
MSTRIKSRLEVGIVAEDAAAEVQVIKERERKKMNDIFFFHSKYTLIYAHHICHVSKLDKRLRAPYLLSLSLINNLCVKNDFRK